MNGTINIFKPIGISSHDVVNALRQKTNIRRIGHAGTLDPNASGVLILCVGKATRISEYLLNLDKEYIGELTLGMETDTQDIEGNIINYSTKKVKLSQIEAAFKSYVGWVEQIPPMYSAVKHKGKKLYQLAREGKTIKRKSRKVFIESLNILNMVDNNKVLFKVKCSKGTYIRTLCDDIGKSLNTYGFLSYLIRTKVGNFHISNSYSLEYIDSLSLDKLSTLIKPIDKSIDFMDSIYVKGRHFNKLINGVIIPLEDFEPREHKENIDYRIYCRDTFIGVGNIINFQGRPSIKMAKVLK